MTALNHILQRAARRDFAARALKHAGCGFAWAAVAALALVLIDRTIGLSMHDAILAAIPALGLLVGVVYAALTRPSRHELAVKLDRELALKDRVGTAHSIRDMALRSDESSAFAELVESDAARVVEGLDIRRATPIRAGGAWGVGIGLVMAVWLCAMYLPLMPLFEDDSDAPNADTNIAAVQQDGKAIAEVVADAIKQLPRDEAQDSRIAQDLAAIDRLADQMSQAQTPDELNKARDDSAARLTQVADRLAEQAREELASAHQIAQRFAGMDAAGAPKPPMSAQEFAEALKRGDFAQASEELEHLLREAGQLPAQDRQALADSLRHASEQLRNGNETDQQQIDERREQLAQALADQGLDKEAIDQLLKPRDESQDSRARKDEPQQQESAASSTQPQLQDQSLKPSPVTSEEVERTLREQGMDEDAARTLARDVQELNQQERSQQQTQRDSKEVSQSLKDTAEQVQDGREPPSKQPPEARESAATQPDKPQSTSRPEEPVGSQQQSSAQSDQNHRDEISNDRRSTEPSGQEQRTTEPSSSQREKPTAQPDGQPAAESSSPTPQAQQQKQPSSSESQPEAASQDKQQDEQPQSQPDSSSQQQPSKQPQTSQPQPGQEQLQQRQVDEKGATEIQQRESPDGQPESEASQPRPDKQSTPNQNQQQQRGPEQSNTPNEQMPPNLPSPTPDAVKALKELAERQSTAEQNQQMSERLRQTARELARNMTPEQREEWARQWQREMGNLDRPPQDSPPESALGKNSRNDADSKVGGQGSSAAMAKPDRTLTGAQTEDVDLRMNDTGDRVIAQWLDGADPNAPQGTAASGASQRIVQAQDAAERAVNDAAVPPRYHSFIKRVFGRLNQTTKEAASGPASVAPSGANGTTPSGAGGGGEK